MANDDKSLMALAEEVGRRLLLKSLKLASAESCTGGWISKVMTDVAGSSDWFDRGFVTYSNNAKTAMLGVSQDTLAQNGAVSEAVVREMALGAVRHSEASAAVAVSGIAGPSGGTPDKPVGTVWIAWAWPDGESTAKLFHFKGDREGVRRAAVEAALAGLRDGLGS
jgi:nicotinamide-nucleotide amidase